MIKKTYLKSTINKIDAYAFLFGFLALFYINVGGQLYISEILLILFAPVLWLKRGKALLRNPDARKIIVFGALWFLGQVVTDIIRKTPKADLMRGWASIIVLLICFSSLYLLLGTNIRRIKIFTLGYALSGLVSLFFQPSPHFASYRWEFGYGQPVILLIFLIIIYISRGQLSGMRRWFWLIIGVGLISIILGARSLGGIMLLTGGIMLFRTNSFTWKLLARPRVVNLILAGLIIFGMVLGIIVGYSYAGRQGLFGEYANYKFELQNNGNIIGSLLGGRVEILASSWAIVDSPIIGHGSWAKDMKYRFYLLELKDLGFNLSLDQLNDLVNSDDLIPAHSHLTQAWVWGGILGAIFWGWVLIFVNKVVLKVNALPNELYLLVIYFGIAAVWDILFSPFGAIYRLVWVLRFLVFLSVKKRGLKN